MGDFRRGAGQRRMTQWAGMAAEDGASDTLPVMVVLTAGTPVFLSQGIDGPLISATNAGLDERATLTRTIANLSAKLVDVAADTEATVAVGCMVVTAAAMVAGVASIRSLEDDAGASWVYYTVFHLRNPKASSIEGSTALDIYREHIDVRSQRKIRNGETIVWIAESEGSGAIVGIGGRYLLKLV